MKVEIGNATLYLGDCAEILPTLGQFDAVVTDPPYGIGANKMTLGNGKFKIERGDSDWDSKPPSVELLNQINNLSKYSIFWGGNYFELPPSRCWLIWDKCTGDNSFADAELAWTNLDKVVKLKKIPWVGANAKDTTQREHPTQKPIKLMEWCIDLLPEKVETIIDPFMGSGTTGVACMNMKKQFIGIEREKKYFDIACKRIEDAQRQVTLF